MLKKILILIFIITLLIPTNNYKSEEKQQNEDIIGRIIIPKLNINKELYETDNQNNTIEKNIEILKESVFPTEENSLMLLAAHSGTGSIAYFNELDKLNVKDEIYLVFNNTKYIYEVKDIWEEEKTGYINLNKENKKQLILTTCSPTKNNYQLVVNCIEKDVN